MKKEKIRKKRHGARRMQKAVNMELHEHKSSYAVFNILRALVIVSLVRQCFLHSYESVFLCALTLALLYVPSWVQVRMKVELPPTLEITILCFIFASEILGELNAFYIVIPFWDTILHVLNGFLCAAIGFSLVLILNNNENLKFDLSPFFLALSAFCFSMTIGVLWEFFECGMDQFFHTDMQKDTVVHAIYSVALDQTKTNTPVAVTDITGTFVNGQDLGVGGYLDLGLLDTMKDLFVNFLGAMFFSITCYFYAKSKGRRDFAAMDFVPEKKAENRDFLKITEEADGKKG